MEIVLKTEMNGSIHGSQNDLRDGSGPMNGSQKDLRTNSSDGNEDKYKGKFTGKSTLKNPFG